MYGVEELPGNNTRNDILGKSKDIGNVLLFYIYYIYHLILYISLLLPEFRAHVFEKFPKGLFKTLIVKGEYNKLKIFTKIHDDQYSALLIFSKYFRRFQKRKYKTRYINQYFLR